MKKTVLFLSLLFFSFLNILASDDPSKILTSHQKKELLERGTITTAEGFWHVKVMPGKKFIKKDFNNILEMAKSFLHFSKKNLHFNFYFRDFFTKNFWKKVVHFPRKIPKRAKKINSQEGFGQLPSDFRKMRKRQQSVRKGEFGYKANYIAGIMNFGLTSSKRIFHSTIVIPTESITLSTIIPAAYITAMGIRGSVFTVAQTGKNAFLLTAPPSAALTTATIGAAYYTAAISWNYLMYFTLRGESLPRNSNIIVEFVPNQD